MRRLPLAATALSLALLAGCVCLRHAVERPERHAIDCAKADPATPADRLCKVTVDGVERAFLLHVPKAPPRQPRWPVVLAFHGVGSNAAQMAHITRLSEIADRERFVVVYPQGLGLVPTWNTAIVGTAKRSDADDTGFVRAILRELDEIAPYDRARVYATGFSNGGFFAHQIACEMSDRIAAIGVVAALNAEAEATCAPARPVPVIAFHGLRDPIVPFDGVEELGVPGVRDSLLGWARRASCAHEPALLEQSGDMRCEHWPGCRARVEVILCVAGEGGHTWPGGRQPTYIGHTPTDMDASETIWAFFERHPLVPAEANAR